MSYGRGIFFCLRADLSYFVYCTWEGNRRRLQSGKLQPCGLFSYDSHFGEYSPPKNSFLQLSHNKLSYTRLFQNHEFSPLSTFTISSKVNCLLSHCLSPYINPRIRFVVLQNRRLHMIGSLLPLVN